MRYLLLLPLILSSVSTLAESLAIGDESRPQTVAVAQDSAFLTCAMVVFKDSRPQGSAFFKAIEGPDGVDTFQGQLGDNKVRLFFKNGQPFKVGTYTLDNNDHAAQMAKFETTLAKARGRMAEQFARHKSQELDTLREMMSKNFPPKLIERQKQKLAEMTGPPEPFGESQRPRKINDKRDYIFMIQALHFHTTSIPVGDEPRPKTSEQVIRVFNQAQSIENRGGNVIFDSRSDEGERDFIMVQCGDLY